MGGICEPRSLPPQPRTQVSHRDRWAQPLRSRRDGGTRLHLLQRGTRCLASRWRSRGIAKRREESMSSQRALVTGGAGFLGSHLCDALLGEGGNVVVIDNLLTGRRHNLEHLKNDSRFDFVEKDICEPFDVGKVDFVFHFAIPGLPPLKVGSLGTFHALDVAHKYGAKYLVSSTSECYGDPLEHPQKETYWGNVNSIGPRSVYDEAKRFTEAVTMAYHRYHKVDTRIVRIFNTYGPRLQLNDGRVISNFMKQALRGEDLTVYGDGSQTRSFCYVSDEVAGILG